MEVHIITEGRQQPVLVETQPLRERRKVRGLITLSTLPYSKLFISLGAKCLLLSRQLPRKPTKPAALSTVSCERAVSVLHLWADLFG